MSERRQLSREELHKYVEGQYDFGETYSSVEEMFTALRKRKTSDSES